MIDGLFELLGAILGVAFSLFVLSQAIGLVMGFIMGVAAVGYVVAVTLKEFVSSHR